MQNTWNDKTINHFVDMVLMDPYSNYVINIDELCNEFNLKPSAVKAKISEFRSKGLISKFDRSSAEYKRLYTKHEDMIIKTMVFEGYSNEKIANELNRSLWSVVDRKHILGLRYSEKWTNDEEAVLIHNIKFDRNIITSNVDELANLLPNHTHRGIRRKIAMLRERDKLPRPLKLGANQSHKDIYRRFIF